MGSASCSGPDDCRAVLRLHAVGELLRGRKRLGSHQHEQRLRGADLLSRYVHLCEELLG